MRRRLIGALGLAIVCVMLTSVTTAAPSKPRTVKVSLTVTREHWARAGYGFLYEPYVSPPDPAQKHSCPLMLPVGADGMVLLHEAHRSRCITSYSTVPAPVDGSGHSRGTEIECIEGDCTRDLGVANQHWRVYQNGRESDAYDQFGLEGLRASSHDQFILSFDGNVGRIPI